MEGPVSQVDVAGWLDRDQSAVSPNIHTAVRDGYVHNQNLGQGKLTITSPGNDETARRTHSRRVRSA
jgi:predicted transcriptional regulator